MTGINDTGKNVIAGVVVTGNFCSLMSLIPAKNLSFGVVVTGDHFSAVSLTPVINLSPVSTTPPIKEKKNP